MVNTNIKKGSRVRITSRWREHQGKLATVELLMDRGQTVILAMDDHSGYRRSPFEGGGWGWRIGIINVEPIGDTPLHQAIISYINRELRRG